MCRFGVSERRIADLMKDMVALTLAELTEIYCVRFTALELWPIVRSAFGRDFSYQEKDTKGSWNKKWQ